MNKAIYIPPTDENGKFYWVPVVIKNKDYLLGFLTGMESAMIALQIYEELNPSLGSERFNDILPDGRRIGNMSRSEFKDHVKTSILDEQESLLVRENHPDHNPDVLDYFFHVSCYCGNFYGFHEPEDIPEENLHCDWCDKILFHYTNKDDTDFQYDGSENDTANVIKAVKQELGIVDDDDDDEDEFY
jgi:hypothetical protein